MAYTAKSYDHLLGTPGFSDALLKNHFTLYQGYVTNTNKVNDELAALAADGKAGTPSFAEMKRRLGWEWNGMRLHEYYFGNMKPGATTTPGGKLKKAMEESFGSYENWLSDFKAVGTSPGVGWAVTFQDPRTGWLSNHWITLHENGIPTGFSPILVMDGWEHAFMRDYKAFERGKYVDAFFKNVDWAAVEKRLK